jgi:hypothetical protein
MACEARRAWPISTLFPRDLDQARDQLPSVFRMDADGGNQINFTLKDPGDSDSDWVSRLPAWSTNGREIYFM